MEGLPWDFPQRTMESMLLLTVEDLMRAWSRIAPEGWTVVVVGDADTIRAPLEGLGLAPVTVVPA